MTLHDLVTLGGLTQVAHVSTAVFTVMTHVMPMMEFEDLGLRQPAKCCLKALSLSSVVSNWVEMKCSTTKTVSMMAADVILVVTVSVSALPFPIWL